MSFAGGAGTVPAVASAHPSLVNLANACGPIAGLLPGQGEAQPARVARALPMDSQRLFVPWNQLGERDVARGLAQIGAL